MKLTIGELQVLNSARMDFLEMAQRYNKKQNVFDAISSKCRDAWIEVANCIPPNETMNTSNLRKYIVRNDFKVKK